MSEFFMFLILLIGNVIITSCYYCSGKPAFTVSDCTSLSTLSYQCCYVDSSSVFSSFITFKFCYGYPAGVDPSKMPAPNSSPKVNINVIECGLPLPNAIKQTDLCGVDSPENATICNTFSSNCCYLNHEGNSFCLDKTSFNAQANGVDLVCSAYYSKINLNLFLSAFFFILVF